MNMPRMLILGVAVIVAGIFAFVARGLLGGGTPKAAAMTAPPPIETAQVLVASSALQPGQPLNPTLVHWQKWPKSDVDSTFITQDMTPDLTAALTGTVVRASIVAGEPLTNTKFVHGDAGGFLAATLPPGMRAVSIPITTESGAGGFILPNDRVDLFMTEQISDNPKRFRARTVIADVLVMAMDQTFKQDRDQKVVLAKTATLELTADQARLVIKAQAAGPLSLALRALGDKSNAPPAATAAAAPGAPHGDNPDDDDPGAGAVKIIRFGVALPSGPGRRN